MLHHGEPVSQESLFPEPIQKMSLKERSKLVTPAFGPSPIRNNHRLMTPEPDEIVIEDFTTRRTLKTELGPEVHSTIRNTVKRVFGEEHIGLVKFNPSTYLEIHVPIPQLLEEDILVPWTNLPVRKTKKHAVSSVPWSLNTCARHSLPDARQIKKSTTVSQITSDPCARYEHSPDVRRFKKHTATMVPSLLNAEDAPNTCARHTFADGPTSSEYFNVLPTKFLESSSRQVSPDVQNGFKNYTAVSSIPAFQAESTTSFCSSDTFADGPTFKECFNLLPIPTLSRTKTPSNLCARQENLPDLKKTKRLAASVIPPSKAATSSPFAKPDIKINKYSTVSKIPTLIAPSKNTFNRNDIVRKDVQKSKNPTIKPSTSGSSVEVSNDLFLTGRSNIRFARSPRCTIGNAARKILLPDPVGVDFVNLRKVDFPTKSPSFSFTKAKLNRCDTLFANSLNPSNSTIRETERPVGQEAKPETSNLDFWPTTTKY